MKPTVPFHALSSSLFPRLYLLFVLSSLCQLMFILLLLRASELFAINRLFRQGCAISSVRDCGKRNKTALHISLIS